MSEETVHGNAPPRQKSGKREQRHRAGIEERQRLPLKALATWTAAADRRDPVEILIEQGNSRIPELLPLRYWRMKADPFAFLRGAAAVMAADLGSAPRSTLRVQACGDAHLDNFGGYATPEGTPIFDINDFDETLPAPFEWDVKRLAASLAVKGRTADMPARESRDLARLAARSYRRRMARLALLPPLDAWTSRIDLEGAVADIGSGKIRRGLEQRLDQIRQSTKAHYGLVERRDGPQRIKDKPGLVHHLSGDEEKQAADAFQSYSQSLQEDRRVLLQRYELRDIAFKVVGVGSVGTFCAIGLFAADDGSRLLLQIKEAQESVLAPYAGASAYAIHGERVVVGEHMLQAATDVFLGWTNAPVGGRYFYVRRLKDYELADVGERLEGALPFYAALCGRTLARGHARAGDALEIASYIGDNSEFDEAIADFAVAYADQTTRDWRSFLAAITAGRVTAAAPPKSK